MKHIPVKNPITQSLIEISPSVGSLCVLTFISSFALQFLSRITPSSLLCTPLSVHPGCDNTFLYSIAHFFPLPLALTVITASDNLKLLASEQTHRKTLDLGTRCMTKQAVQQLDKTHVKLQSGGVPGDTGGCLSSEDFNKLS